MSFRIRDLGVIGYVGGMTLWAYRTGDSLEEIGAPGYFDEAFSTVRPGDFILVSAGLIGWMIYVRHAGDDRVITRGLCVTS